MYKYWKALHPNTKDKYLLNTFVLLLADMLIDKYRIEFIK